MAPAIAAQHLNDDTPGRALDALYTYEVTELYRLMAATAAQRLGLTPTVVHLDGTSFYVDGRDTSDRGPNVQVIHITRGDSRDHRPDLNHVMLELMVEHHAGIPVLMQPLSGNSRDAREFGKSSGHIFNRCTPPKARPRWWPIVPSTAKRTLGSSRRST